MQAMRACRQQLAPCAAAAAAPQLLWRRPVPGRRCSGLWQQQQQRHERRDEQVTVHADTQRAGGLRRCSAAAAAPPPSQPPSQPPQLAWLAEVSTLLPCSSSDSDANNGNGSSSGGGSAWRAPQYQQLPPGEPNTMQLDAIFVLAGGLLPDGGLPEWVHRRLDLARDLHLQQRRAPPIVCLGGGTPHKPAVLGPTGHVLHESTACASYLMATGVAAADICKETSSHDTVGNAFFGLAIHALPAGWRRLAVVTSAFHMPRSRELFADMARAAGRSLAHDPDWLSLTFLSASDAGVFDDDVYAARLGKEAGSLAHWQAVAPSLPSLPALRAWLHDDHLCYAVPRQHEFGKRTIKDQRLLDSY